MQPHITLHALIAAMRDATARTFNPHLRFHNEIDAVLYGKMVELDVFGESLLSSHITRDDASDLASATADLHRAINHLHPLIFAEA
jgi:hypothetical protein